jgi:hypothetical protein
MPRQSKASSASAPDTAEHIATLSELCTEAAEHVAHARIALFAESADTDGALTHLDEAIACLKRLLANSRSSVNGSRPRLRSVLSHR